MKLELGLAIFKNDPVKIPFLKELDLVSYVNCKWKQVYYYHEEEDNCTTLSYDGDYDNKLKKRYF